MGDDNFPPLLAMAVLLKDVGYSDEEIGEPT